MLELRVARPRRRVATGVGAGAVAALTALSLLSACTNDDPPASAAQVMNPVLTRTVQAVDAATSVKVDIIGREVPGGDDTIRLLRGGGWLTRPTPTSAAYRGTAQMLVNNTETSFEMVSYRGTFYLRTKGAPRYQPTDQTSFGMLDPARLIRRKVGLEQLLSGMKSVQDKGIREVDGVREHTMEGEITGLLAHRFLPISNVYQPVRLTLTINEETARPISAVITGFFFKRDKSCTYDLVFTGWNKKVTVKRPRT